jgi:uroporphyrin-III C-methyltransferase
LSVIAEKGKVYLVGAGPGDPEQLTVRALRLLSSADFIFHDDLVPSQILALARVDAQVVSVGKRCGRKSISQDEINAALVREARAGHSVVRLKSGDPLLFGRAAEELEALQAAHIPMEVAPGISAAFAAASALQISLTHRRFASKIIFLTAHRAEHSIAPIWSGALPQDATLAIYMPGTDYGRLGSELMACGLSGDMPGLIVSHIGLPGQRTQQSTLSQLRQLDALPAPALLLVGRVFATNIPFVKNESVCATPLHGRISDASPNAMV